MVLPRSDRGQTPDAHAHRKTKDRHPAQSGIGADGRQRAEGPRRRDGPPTQVSPATRPSGATGHKSQPGGQDQAARHHRPPQ